MSVTGIAGTELGAGRWRHRRAGRSDFLGRLLGRTRRADRRDDPRRVRRCSRSFPALFVGPLADRDLAPPASRSSRRALTYPFGTDELGRDLLNLTVHGARISMTIGLMATIDHDRHRRRWSGIVAGFVGGTIDNAADAPVRLLPRPADDRPRPDPRARSSSTSSAPQAELFGIRSTLIVIVVVIGLTSWATTARVIRSQVLSLKERMFVDRARVIGSGPGRIMRRHILPNVVNLIVAQSVLTFATAVFTETTLAFIGLGDPTAPSWGQILNNAQTAGAPGLGAWWYIAPPAVAVVLVVLAFTLVGNALDDVLNPKALSRR